MQLFTSLMPLLQGGVVLTLRLSVAAGQNIQLDFLPQGKNSSTGVGLPATALVGTAQELDENLEAYLAKYAASVTRIADVVAQADLQLKSIEDTAAAQARKAVEERSKAKPSSKLPAKTAQAGAAADSDDAEDEAPLLCTGGDGNTGDGPADSNPASGDSISRDLFIG